ncbi:vacuolar protein sorting-associated protein, putative [Actinidia rufa]|uniref:Vacuolar protein sorting-associated protein, putative n=1 Tax=Actinidia rufa TaxID=165716 RepID=A0A7J0F5B7_9ERIC|nr:vacuolar protein sorting-associated protein, putative [Actinidia rufa]
MNPEKLLSVEWSDDLKGGKAVCLSGVLDKLSYKVRRAFLVEPMRYSFSTAHCSLKFEDGQVANLHFLIQSVVRDIPVIQLDNYGYAPGNRDSPVALQEQKEIFLLPTVRVFNLLQTEIQVLLTDMDPCAAIGSENVGNQATIPCGSTVDLYANPATIRFIVTLTAFNSSCKPVNSGDWVKKLQKRKDDVHYLDIDLDFCGGKYFASLRLSRGHRGVLEVAIFTSYALKNESDIPLFCFAPNQKPFSGNNKLRLKLLEEKSSEVLLDLDALSGLTEISLEVEERSGFKYIAKLGVSLGPFTSKVNVSSQIISIIPRYVVFNESEEAIVVRQCYSEDDMEGMVAISSKQKIALKLRSGTNRREISGFEKLVKKHRNAHDDSLAFIQFRPDKAGLDCHVTSQGNGSPEFAAVHVVEESSTLVLHFHKPPNVNLPYRIENILQQAFITYYQKDSMEIENLGSGSSVDYVWDDSTLPHRLLVQINGINFLYCL